ncbi:hypothetical protein SAMN05421579_13337 [Xenorhabdus japonica]|uniref:Uncharacterized protein n=1 Tax=Xenorhabdus japonica TaxID=53341 RepID=A0A1I5D2F9_9GAMM|nr:hypothetical protein SAMN05421579_13337 [Xenorhabdus japonica]
MVFGTKLRYDPAKTKSAQGKWQEADLTSKAKTPIRPKASALQNITLPL